MALAQIEPRVMGLDIQILAHARSALSESAFSRHITVWEGDSAGEEAGILVEEFIRLSPGTGPGILILDSDHSHAHVLSELRRHGGSLPVGSLILVADTLIEEFPSGHYPDRPWDKGNNPLTAVQAFLSERRDFQVCQRWNRRGLLTEFRDGILERVDVSE
jgi:cephalosporin hydroxylase